MVKVKGSKSKLVKPRRGREIAVWRQIILVSTLILTLIFSLFFWGTQGLVKLASFLGTFRSSGQPIEQTRQLPLLAPRLAPLPIATNSARISISGMAESGTTVEVFVNEISGGAALVEQDNRFQIPDIIIASGENKIYAIARRGKEESPPSRTIYLMLKEFPPKLEVDNPADRATFSGEENKIEVRGKTDPQANITVNGHWAIVAPDGSFSFELLLLEDQNPIEVVATDTAGNQTKVNLSVTYVH